ncbi:TIGR03767 family metallophosphoesterase [Rhodococcus sp. NPDC058532]|uniref:TIGR03767 family metallophosphoesterase n=1 Tax=Rhodococcus sp. NPDC058532 TaxID=3346540 RepID=UPI00365E4922
MANLNRRDFLGLAGLGAAGLLGVGALGRAPWGTWYAAADTAAIAGTTLETVAAPVGAAGYRTLTAGPGLPMIVRGELAEPRPGREDRRTALAALVQLTDLHILDAQSPMRFEYVHQFTGSAFRPQETLTTQGLVALVARVNALGRGPHTRRDFDAVVTTGDNTDNKEHAELNWFLAALNGGTFVPNTGAAGRYEGVQNSGSELYWNPESDLPDRYQRAGFPPMPGLLGAALRPVTSPGLRTPWYCVFGNHDDAVQGTVPSGIGPLEAMYTGGLKIESPNSEQARAIGSAASADPGALVAALAAVTTPPRIVTPDPARAPFTPRQFIAAHLDPENTGPGPVGHGFAPDAGETGIGYYTFEIARGGGAVPELPSVVGISMDSTNRAGFVEGSLGEAQFRWIERTLEAGSSRHHDRDGRVVSRAVDDTWFLLFSHHTSDTMDNLLPDPENPGERRYGGGELVDLLHRFPNVLGWVNGHTHQNRITPHPGATPAQGFWEINTASHVDFPQHARVIEVTDNGDGTISLLTTLNEADSRYEVRHGDHSPAGLASLYRELSFNDIHADAALFGGPGDHNTELLLPSPRG